MKIEEAYVYIVGGDDLIQRMYEQRGVKVVKTFAEANVIQFTGGSDVSPEYYNSERHPTTSCNPARDQEEYRLFKKMSHGHQLAVGICRGAQFLCVLNGGRLFQDVDNHANGRPHRLMYFNEEDCIEYSEVTSTHHQMMFPGIPKPQRERALFDGNLWEVWGACNLSTYRDQARDHRRETNPLEGPDNEIIFWPQTNSLGFQGHPEYGNKTCHDLFFTCFERAFKKVSVGWHEQYEAVNKAKARKAV